MNFQQLFKLTAGYRTTKSRIVDQGCCSILNRDPFPVDIIQKHEIPVILLQNRDDPGGMILRIILPPDQFKCTIIHSGCNTRPVTLLAYQTLLFNCMSKGFGNGYQYDNSSRWYTHRYGRYCNSVSLDCKCSNLLNLCIHGVLAQLARALHSHCRGHRFKSGILHGTSDE